MCPSPTAASSPFATPLRRAVVLLAGAGVVGATLTGCSTISDIVVGQAGQTACAIGSQAVDQIASDVTTAVGNIAIDPAAALAALKAADAALTVAVVGIVDEPAVTAAGNAKATLGELIALAQDAVDGIQVDDAAVQALQEQFTADLTALAGAC